MLHHLDRNYSGNKVWFMSDAFNHFESHKRLKYWFAQAYLGIYPVLLGAVCLKRSHCCMSSCFAKRSFHVK